MSGPHQYGDHVEGDAARARDDALLSRCAGPAPPQTVHDMRYSMCPECAPVAAERAAEPLCTCGRSRDDHDEQGRTDDGGCSGFVPAAEDA